MGTHPIFESDFDCLTDMGIANLYKFLDPVVSSGNLRSYAGKVIAVDMPCWIHRGAIADAKNIVMSNGLKGTEAVNKFVRKRLELLQRYKIHVICVFDGNKLPSKLATNQARRLKRDQARVKAIEALKNEPHKAYQFFCQAIKITPEINEAARKLCIEMGFQVIVAPYEADAQLAHLYLTKTADAVMTEDSDLIIFGTGKLLVKLDDNSGALVEIDATNLKKVESLESFMSECDRVKWLRFACIMQGCDYYPQGLPGVGLKTGIKICARAFSDGVSTMADLLKNKEKYFSTKMLDKWESDAAEKILKAEETFNYQLILDTKTRQITPLVKYPEGKDSENFSHCGCLTQSTSDAQTTLSQLDLNLIKSETPQAKIKTENSMILSQQRKRAEKRKSESNIDSKPKREVKRDTSWRLEITKSAEISSRG